MGVGQSLALGSILQIPKINLPQVTIKKTSVSGTRSTVDFNSYGTVYLTNFIRPGHDLKPTDFEGGTLYIEGGLGYLSVGGIAGSIMLVGIDPVMLQLSIVHLSFQQLAFRSAKAIVMIAGLSEGLQDSLGFNAMIGTINYQGAYYSVVER